MDTGLWEGSKQKLAGSLTVDVGFGLDWSGAFWQWALCLHYAEKGIEGCSLKGLLA